MAKKNTIEFRGITVEYDGSVLKSWKFQRKLANLTDDAARVFHAADAILCGSADAVAEQLGDDVEVMGELLAAITESMGAKAKN